MADPEIRDLQVATARAYAIAERLASELESTVVELMSRVGDRPQFHPADTASSGTGTQRKRGRVL